jgi:hypothetical protein
MSVWQCEAYYDFSTRAGCPKCPIGPFFSWRQAERNLSRPMCPVSFHTLGVPGWTGVTKECQVWFAEDFHVPSSEGRVLEVPAPSTLCFTSGETNWTTTTGLKWVSLSYWYCHKLSECISISLDVSEVAIPSLVIVYIGIKFADQLLIIIF